MAKRELQNYSSRKIYKYIYEFIHQKLFYRNIPLLIENLLKSYIHYHNPSNLSLLIQSLDIYSLGMIPFILLIDHSDTLKIPPSKLLSLLKLPELKSYLQLFQNMTTFYSSDRINPNDAYKLYMNLKYNK